MISKRSSLLLFIREVRADPIPMESANPSSYRDVHPGLLLIMCCLLPKANCASMPHNLQPDRKLTFPFSAIYKGFLIPQVNLAAFQNINVVPPFPVVSVIDVFFQCSGLGDGMLDNLWSRLALPQKENSLEVTSGMPATKIMFCRNLCMDGSF